MAKIKEKQIKLTSEEKDELSFVKTRIIQMQEARKSVYGVDIEAIWKDADKDYAPHRLGTSGKKMMVQDEDRGWRGSSSIVEMGGTTWQSDISKPNIFLKIQTALSILVDKNPTGVFTPSTKKFKEVTKLIEQLYYQTWEVAQSKKQLKLFIFNMAKYGWAIARTYPLKRTVTLRNGKEVVEYDDIFRENLDPWNAWIDDMARPGSEMRDWCYRKVYSYLDAKAEFGSYEKFSMVKPKGGITEKIDSGSKDKEFKETELVEAYFYENKNKDLFMVILNDIPVVVDELPVENLNGSKKLSCWHSYWMLRHAECPYGVGIYESARYDQALLDRIRNMTIDQLTLSIYKMFFHSGTENMTETGDIKITPGVGKQVVDPKNITWLDVPTPGAEAWKGIEMLQSDVDKDTGITETMEGEVTGKTAYEVAQAREAALKKLKVPLDNITDALETEGYITICLMRMLYSEPEVYEISDPALIERYLAEIKSDPELFERETDEEGNEKFKAKVYREFPVNLESDEKGNMKSTKDTKFFRIKPEFLKWEGVIHIKGQAILNPSKELTKALEMEMYNILIPLMVQPPELVGKIAREIVKLYEKDPKDVLPDSFLNEKPQSPPLVVPQEEAVMGQMAEMGIEPKMAVSKENPQGVGDKMISRVAQPFKKI